MKTALLILALLIITAIAVRLTYISRGEFAVGGEWLIGAIPLLIYISSGKEGENEDQG